MNESPHKLFTLEEARSALPLVKRIAGDLAGAVDKLTALPGGVATLYGASHVDDLPDGIREPARELREQILSLTGELDEIGAELKGYQPVLVDFPALVNGEPIYYCWAHGEQEIDHWHSLTAGFRGRKSL